MSAPTDMYTFFKRMDSDMRQFNREHLATNQLEEAIENYEKVMGVKLKIEIKKDETCS